MKPAGVELLCSTLLASELFALFRMAIQWGNPPKTLSPHDARRVASLVSHHGSSLPACRIRLKRHKSLYVR
jgi:hypothetical protein